jgi:chromosome segregation ATPase
MKSRVTLSLADSVAQQIAGLHSAEEKLACVMGELAMADEKRAKLQMLADDHAKTIGQLETALRVKQDEIGGLQYNLERLKRRLNVLQEESKGKVAPAHQSGGMLGELKSSLGFFKSNKAPVDLQDDTHELKERLAELIAQNGNLKQLNRALQPRNSRIKKK